MVLAKTSMGVALALACSLGGTAYASVTPSPRPKAKQEFASAKSAAGKAAEGCWFSAHQPFRLHTHDRYVHGESKITRCTTPAPVYCRLESRLQMWISYPGQWVQKGKWKDSGWRKCRPGTTLTPSYKCPVHSTKHKFVTDSWLAIVGHQGGTATNYVTSPSKSFICD
jgi:hypothetical protein